MTDSVDYCQRRYQRYYTSIPVEIRDRDMHLRFKTELMDISCSGLCCHSPIRLPAGDHVSIKFPVVVNNQPLDGHIVWCRKSKEDYETGVEFDSFDENRNMWMCDQISRYEEERQKADEIQS